MSKGWIVGAALISVLGLPAAGRAHGGHRHTVMGTVTTHRDQHLEVKTQEGKTVAILLSEKTSVLRGKTRLDLAAVKEGQRVVVDVGDGKRPLNAKEIKLGDTPAPRK
jgi:hypothetical protein